MESQTRGETRNTERIITSEFMQTEEMKDDQQTKDKRQKIMGTKETIKGSIIDTITAPDKFDKVIAQPGDGAEEVGDDGGAPVTHLSPREDIAQEGGSHHEEVDKDTKNPQEVTRHIITIIIETSTDVQVDEEEEEGGAISMNIADEPAIIDISHDVFDTQIGGINGTRIMHSQSDTTDNHDKPNEAQEAAKVPEVVNVFGGGRVD